MFSEEELNEFVNRMFDNAAKNNNNSDVKNALQTFRKYLESTKMCSLEYLKKLDKIIECSSELITLKSKVNSFDITSVIKTGSEKTPKSDPKQKTYGTYPSSSSCMNSTPSSSRCGNSTPSYSDSCGGGSSYFSRC